jgi:S-formylglutathione hydrolase
LKIPYLLLSHIIIIIIVTLKPTSLQIALKNQDMFKSVSAFAPMSNPSECAWGKKAFGKYIGEDEEQWKEWDPTRVMQVSISTSLWLKVFFSILVVSCFMWSGLLDSFDVLLSRLIISLA